jgi:hypothetical protein
VKYPKPNYQQQENNRSDTNPLKSQKEEKTRAFNQALKNLSPQQHSFRTHSQLLKA